MAAKHPNFKFLRALDPQLAKFGALAEYYFKNGPNKVSLMYARSFGEHMVQRIRDREGLEIIPMESYAELVSRLHSYIPEGHRDDFYTNRKFGNNLHEHAYEPSDEVTLKALISARRLAAWYYDQYRPKPQFDQRFFAAIVAVLLIVACVAIFKIGFGDWRIPAPPVSVGRLPIRDGRYAQEKIACDTAPMSLSAVIAGGVPLYSPQYGKCATRIVRRARNIYVVTPECTGGSPGDPPVTTYEVLGLEKFIMQNELVRRVMRRCSSL